MNCLVLLKEDLKKMKKVKILTVFGTRPEVIKLAPFIKSVEADSDCISITCATTQHNELQNEVLRLFNIRPNHDLNIMKDDQDLFHITETILNRIRDVLNIEEPDFIVVQGDTSTAFSAALGGFYKKIPVVHIEAGLRTGNIHYPYPEEMNRTLLSRVASFHMVPTQRAVENLKNEGIKENVFKVGNTIVDSIEWILNHNSVKNSNVQQLLQLKGQKILVTVHRRENLGDPLKEICASIVELTHMYPECQFVWPVHPNPNVKQYVRARMDKIKNVFLMDSISYSDLICVLNNSSLILSDSGGIQEEACILGKNILILRNETERPEVVECGFGVLVGTDAIKIKSYFEKMIGQNNYHGKASAKDVFGKPGVSKNILSVIKQYKKKI